MTRSFGLDALSGLEALRKAAKRFKEDDLDADLARDCAGKAWHLCDHVLKVLSPDFTLQDLKEFQRQIRAACPDLGFLQDICVESKHAQITKYPPSIDEARVHTGDFSAKPVFAIAPPCRPREARALLRIEVIDRAAFEVHQVNDTGRNVLVHLGYSSIQALAEFAPSVVTCPRGQGWPGCRPTSGPSLPRAGSRLHPRSGPPR